MPAVFRFLDTGRRPENGLARQFLQAHSADGASSLLPARCSRAQLCSLSACAGNQSRVRTTGDQSGTALLFCTLECVMLYVEYMAVSIFIAGVAQARDGSECEDAVECAERIGTGLTAYGIAVGYFAWRYATFFGEASHEVVLDGIGLSWEKLRIGLAPCLVLAVHVVGNVTAAGWLLPEEHATPSWSRFSDRPTVAARAVLMSPLLEEVVFRGLMSCVVYNRCRETKPLVVNTMFAAIHLSNMWGTDTPREEVYMQCGMALVLGWYYALRLRRFGSLWETMLMHAVNNILAVLFDASLVTDRATLLSGVAATIGLYALAACYESWALRTEKQADGGAAAAAALAALKAD